MTRRTVVLAESTFGGKLILDLSPVHAYRCPARTTEWRPDTCTCGATDLETTREQLGLAVAALAARQVTR